ncbi:hypothetical protein VTK56DRAFT_9640 [Thermocarpiscus australiensis]
MQLTTALLLSLLQSLPFTLAGTTTTNPLHPHAPREPSSSSSTTTTITLRIPPHPLLPNPHTLPSSTRATLSSLGKALAAPLSTVNTFVFRNVTPGSYLVDVHCPTHAFVPLRLDLAAARGDAAADGDTREDGQEEKKKKKKGGLSVAAWETYRGNDWGNKGEAVPVADEVGRLGGKVVDLQVGGEKGYFMERSRFSLMSIFSNPIILLSLVSMALFFGMPKLVENMDPEMRAEWEERQKDNPMNALLGGASGQQANPLSDFDMAAFLAGSSSSKSQESNAGSGSGKGKGESRKKK